MVIEVAILCCRGCSVSARMMEPCANNVFFFTQSNDSVDCFGPRWECKVNCCIHIFAAGPISLRREGRKVFFVHRRKSCQLLRLSYRHSDGGFLLVAGPG